MFQSHLGLMQGSLEKKMNITTFDNHHFNEKTNYGCFTLGQGRIKKNGQLLVLVYSANIIHNFQI